MTCDTPRTIEWVGGDRRLRPPDRPDAAADASWRTATAAPSRTSGRRSARCASAAPRPSASRRPMGVVLGVQSVAETTRRFASACSEVAAYLRTSRPTAVNLFWALDRMERASQACDRAWSPRRADATAARRGPRDRGRGPRACAAPSAGRRRADRRRAGRADPLQRRRPGHGRLRHGPGRDLHRRRAGAGASTSSPTRPGRCSRGPG